MGNFAVMMRNIASEQRKIAVPKRNIATERRKIAVQIRNIDASGHNFPVNCKKKGNHVGIFLADKYNIDAQLCDMPDKN